MSLSREGVPILTEGVISNGLVAENRFIGADGAYALAAGNSIGVSCTNAISVERPNISAATLGLCYVIAGADFAKGVNLEVGADGKAIELAVGVSVARAREEGIADRKTLIYLIPN